MQYKSKFLQETFNSFRKYIQQHLTHSYQIRPMISYIKNNYNHQNLIGIEIGVLHGDNAYSIMTNLYMRKLYLIDPFKSTAQQLNVFKDKVIFIVKKSEDAGDDVPNSIDFVYIDGDHSYDGVKKDIDLYYPKVKSGGIIGGHDFRADESGVAKAVLEFVDKNNLKLQGFKMDWWITKP